jgi:hypothetical protein
VFRLQGWGFGPTLIVLLGCAAQQAPVVTIVQTTRPNALKAAAQTAVPVEYDLEVTNPFDHPVTLTSVELETVGYSGGYAMKRVRHSFSQVIAARSKATIEMRAWVQPLQENVATEVAGSVMLRGIARFESQGRPVQRSFAAHVSP